MRTPHSSRTFGINVLGWLAAGAALCATLAACSDSIHLDPEPGVGGQGGVGPATGGGGSAPVTCRSNAECTYPTAVCDTVARECVECLEVADCAAKPGTVCSLGACACQTMGESYCPTLGAQTARCVDMTTSQNDCGACGHACFGACNEGKCADPWEPTSLNNAPTARTRHVAVWDSADGVMIVWGGNGPGGMQSTGGMYDPVKGTWKPTSTVNVPPGRQDATAVWDDAHKLMLVWGGRIGSTPTNTGGIYNPATNTWAPISMAGVPEARWGHSAVWTGTRMIVWGGTDNTSYFANGASFDPVKNEWTGAISGGLTGRYDHTAVWTGSTMVVWGGYGTDGVTNGVYLGDGAVYDMTNWVPLSATSAPTPRRGHTAVWSGMSMLIWGGADTTGQLGDGAKYAGGSWYPMNNPSPEPREGHTAVWIAKTSEMLIWGGTGPGGRLGAGYRLNETSLNWSTPLPTAPDARAHHTAVVFDNKMLIWGGDTNAGNTNTGAIFDATAP